MWSPPSCVAFLAGLLFFVVVQPSTCEYVDTFLLVKVQLEQDTLLSKFDIHILEDTLKEAYYRCNGDDGVSAVHVIKEASLSTGVECSMMPAVIDGGADSGNATHTTNTSKNKSKWKNFLRGNDGEDFYDDQCIYEARAGISSWLFQVQGMVTNSSRLLLQPDEFGDEPESLPCPRRPTADELTTRWSTLLAGIRPSEHLSNIVGIVEMEEEGSDTCNATDEDVQTISTNLILDIYGDPTGITETSKQVLAEACIQIYNSMNALNGSVCDPKYRILESATVATNILDFENNDLGNDITSVSPSPSPSISTTVQFPSVSPSAIPTIRTVESEFLSFTLVITMTGKCNGCSFDEQLFDDVVVGSRRLMPLVLQKEEEADATLLQKVSAYTDGSSVSIGRNLAVSRLPKDFTDGCFCPVGDHQVQGPTSDSFLESWGLSIAPFRDDIDFIQRLVGVREESCIQGDVFSSFLELSFSSDGADKTDTVLGIGALLEDTIVAAYNENTDNICDPQRRTLTDAALITMPDDLSSSSLSSTEDGVRYLRRLRNLDEASDMPSSIPTAAPNNSSSLLPSSTPSSAPTIRGPNLFSLMFRITGECAGCASDFALFDDLNVRLLKESSSFESGCQCENETLAEQGQTADDFVKQFNEKLQKSNETAVVDLQVKDAEQSESDPVPSEMPSSSPSVQASEEPTSVLSDFPSLLPTINPSFAPSVERSSAGMGVPSSIPSDVPSGTPSVAPSSSPSLEPSRSPSAVPSVSPSSTPSTKPSDAPSPAPSALPTQTPSALPTVFECDFTPSYYLTQDNIRLDSVDIQDEVSSRLEFRARNFNGDRIILEDSFCSEGAVLGEYFAGEAVLEYDNTADYSFLGIQIPCNQVVDVVVFSGCPSAPDGSLFTTKCVGSASGGATEVTEPICSSASSDTTTFTWILIPVNASVKHYHVKFYQSPNTPAPSDEPTPAPSDQPTPAPTVAPSPSPSQNPTTSSPSFFPSSDPTFQATPSSRGVTPVALYVPNQTPFDFYVPSETLSSPGIAVPDAKDENGDPIRA